MIAQHFAYEMPSDMGQATALLDQHGDDIAVLGGGTWLVPNMTSGAQSPKIVLDARHLGLQGISETSDAVVLGARVTYEQLKSSPTVRHGAPLLTLMAQEITGGLQITGQGTIGGSACYGNPASDVPACLVALRARLRLNSATGQRDMAADDFFAAGAFTTARRAGELLTEIVIPKEASTRAGYYKLKFSGGSWPIVTAACIAQGDSLIRIAIGAACPTPVVFELPISGMTARDLEAKVVQTAAAMIVDEWSDEFAGPGYRRQVAGAIAVRALRACQGTLR